MAKEKIREGKTAFRTSIGGQALMEGILMRGPERDAIVLRNQETGGLTEKIEERKMTQTRHPFLKIPFVRGPVMLVESMVRGVRALMYSAEQLPEEQQEQPSRMDLWLEKKLGSEKAMSVVMSIAVVLGVGLALLLFFILPTLATGGILHFFPDFPMWGRNLIEGVIKIIIFMAYLILCSKQRDIKRLFSYHGAEHKTIFCYERGLPLTVENVRTQPRHHPRCGTSFLFVVIVVSILASSLVFSFWQVTNVWLRTLAHLVLLPVVIAITYEFNRLVGRHDNWLTRILTAPGMWMQNFTTNEPEDDMMEVAIRALSLVLPREAGSDKW